MRLGALSGLHYEVRITEPPYHRSFTVIEIGAFTDSPSINTKNYHQNRLKFSARSNAMS
jgi:hypothetical protein